MQKSSLTDNRIDKEEKQNEQSNVWKRLKRFDECPQQSSNAFALGQQFNETHNTK